MAKKYDEENVPGSDSLLSPECPDPTSESESVGEAESADVLLLNNEQETERTEDLRQSQSLNTLLLTTLSTSSEEPKSKAADTEAEKSSVFAILPSPTRTHENWSPLLSPVSFPEIALNAGTHPVPFIPASVATSYPSDSHSGNCKSSILRSDLDSKVEVALPHSDSGSGSGLRVIPVGDSFVTVWVPIHENELTASEDKEDHLGRRNRHNFALGAPSNIQDGIIGIKGLRLRETPVSAIPQLRSARTYAALSRWLEFLGFTLEVETEAAATRSRTSSTEPVEASIPGQSPHSGLGWDNNCDDSYSNDPAATESEPTNIEEKGG